MTDIRLALVFGGPRAADYAAAAARLDGASLLAAVEHSADEARAAAAATGAEISCAADGELPLPLRLAEVDAAVICRGRGPLGEQGREIAEVLAAAGKHLLVDGSLAASAAEVEQLLGAVDDAAEEKPPPRVMVACPDWFRPSVQAILGSVGDGKLGPPGLLRLHRWRGAADEAADIRLAELAEDVWLAQSVFDARPEIVWARRAGSDDGRSRSLLLHLGFPQGGMALLDLSQVEGGAEYFTCSLIGASGAAYADDHHNTQLAFADGSAAAVPTSERRAALTAQLREFVDAIREDRRPRPDGRDFADALRIVGAAEASLEEDAAAPVS